MNERRVCCGGLRGQPHLPGCFLHIRREAAQKSYEAKCQALGHDWGAVAYWTHVHRANFEWLMAPKPGELIAPEPIRAQGWRYCQCCQRVRQLVDQDMKPIRMEEG